MSEEISTETNTLPTYYRPSIERLRIILMFFMCINLFGFPTPFGDLVKLACGFVSLAFFILSGFLVLRESPNRPKRILRAIKRTAIVFGVLAVVYFLLNFIYYRSLGVESSAIFSIFGEKRLWFNFLVLNVWPSPFVIGSAIWYVQALLYGYIIIYFLDKWKLLKLDWLFAAIFLVITVLSGEFAGIINVTIAGYNYLPGNFLTRALPYLLIGSFIHRNMKTLTSVKKGRFYFAAVGGIALVFAEVLLLGYAGKPGYYGHLIGYGMTAVSVCILAFKAKHKSGFEKTLKMSRTHINFIYYLCQPVGVGIALLIAFFFGNEVFANTSEFIGLITFVVCFGIAWAISYIGRKAPWAFAFIGKKYFNKTNKNG